MRGCGPRGEWPAVPIGAPCQPRDSLLSQQDQDLLLSPLPHGCLPHPAPHCVPEYTPRVASSPTGASRLMWLTVGCRAGGHSPLPPLQWMEGTGGPAALRKVSRGTLMGWRRPQVQLSSWEAGKWVRSRMTPWEPRALHSQATASSLPGDAALRAQPFLFASVCCSPAEGLVQDCSLNESES